MTFASILILGAVLTPHMGGPDQSRASTIAAPAGSTLVRSTFEACWDRGDLPDPGRDDPSSFLWEDEDEDDTFEDAPLASGHGRDSAAPMIGAAGPYAGRLPVRVPCRSALPTLRLRC